MESKIAMEWPNSCFLSFLMKVSTVQIRTEESSSERLWIENPFKGIMIMDNSNDGRCVYTFLEYK